MNVKINHAPKTQRQIHGTTVLCELFLLTVPIEEVARCQYKTVLIIFPLSLQTITITIDVVKWRGGEMGWTWAAPCMGRVGSNILNPCLSLSAESLI